MCVCVCVCDGVRWFLMMMLCVCRSKFNELSLEHPFQRELIWTPLSSVDGTFVPPLWNIRVPAYSVQTWAIRKTEAYTHHPFLMARPIARYYRRHVLNEDIPEFWEKLPGDTRTYAEFKQPMFQ